VILQDWRVAPLSRVQTVDTRRGPLQQWLGLSPRTVDLAADVRHRLAGLTVVATGTGRQGGEADDEL